jgi:hypothetical protein
MPCKTVFTDSPRLFRIKNIFSNCRPISIATGFAKVFEIAIFRRLSDHIETHKILLPEQYGFQKELSTEYAIYINKCNTYSLE